MADEAEFPRSPLRDYDPFGQKSGANPFAEPHVAKAADSAEEDGNVYAASSSLADPAPQVEYEAVLEPRIIVLTATAAMGISIAAIGTLLLIFFPPSGGEVAAHAIIFPIGFCMFVGAILLAQFDLTAMRRGAMKRDQVHLVGRWRWIGWLGLVYCLGLEVFCLWPLLEDLFNTAFR